MKVWQAILEGSNNTLHMGRTQRQSNEYCSFQVTRGDGSKGLSMGFEDKSSGSADDTSLLQKTYLLNYQS